MHGDESPVVRVLSSEARIPVPALKRRVMHGDKSPVVRVLSSEARIPVSALKRRVMHGDKSPVVRVLSSEVQAFQRRLCIARRFIAGIGESKYV